MRHIRRTITLATCVALAAPTAALAGQPRLLGQANGSSPTVTAGPDGAFHAVYNDENANAIVYCRITPESIADSDDPCVQRTSIPFNDASDGTSRAGAPGKAWVIADEPGVLRLVLPQYVSGKSYTWISSDSGATWAGPTMLGRPYHGTDSERPLFDGAGQNLLMPSWNPGAFVSRARVDGSESTNDNVKATLSGGGHNFLIYNLSLGKVPGATLATADNLDLVAHWILPDGADANDGAAWGAPTVIGAGTDSTMSAGGAEAWVGYTTKGPGPSRLVMRRWTGAGFGRPRLIERTHGYLADAYVAANGVPGVAYRRNGTGLRFAQLRPGTGRFTKRTIVRRDDVFHNLVLAHDGSGRGVVVWTRSDGVYAADLNEDYNPHAGRTRIFNARNGIVVRLGMPAGCVRRGTRILLTSAVRGRARLMRVRHRVGPVVSVDRRWPWRTRVRIPATATPGSTLMVSSTMTLRRTVRGFPIGASFRRVLIGRLTVCG